MSIQDILQEDNVSIIDVREAFEFRMDHLPQAIHMPLSKFNQYLDKISQMEGSKVFYCRSGNRSGQVVDFLKQKGFKNVYNGGSLMMMRNFLLPV